uniref:Uncharacterized protein n=1 Tax=Timema shepardi TaxID=629360 RepID=A0A7R9FV12_TIMSH|nr:unnamed protein product [Timema shepardi]
MCLNVGCQKSAVNCQSASKKPWGYCIYQQPPPEQEEDVFHQKDYEWVLGDELAQTAKLELREDKDIRNQTLRQFREWINKNQDLHRCCTDGGGSLKDACHQMEAAVIKWRWQPEVRLSSVGGGSLKCGCHQMEGAA